MKINFNNIINVYGNDVFLLIMENKEVVIKNIEYLNKLNFTDIENIFERYAILFLVSPSEFKYKINNLIKEIGSDYIEIIENDLSIFEKLL